VFFWPVLKFLKRGVRTAVTSRCVDGLIRVSAWGETAEHIQAVAGHGCARKRTAPHLAPIGTSRVVFYLEAPLA